MQRLKKYLVVFRGNYFQLTMDLLLAVGLPFSRPISLKTRKAQRLRVKFKPFPSLHQLYILIKLP